MCAGVKVRPSPPRLVEPILSVITLMHPKRPTMQARNLASVEALGPTAEHVLVYMRISDAPAAAHEVMADPELEEHIAGRYVMVVDDDDELVEPRLSELLRRQAYADNWPAWYMVKAELGDPYNGTWPVWSPGKPVEFSTANICAPFDVVAWRPGDTPGRVSTLNMIVRCDIWKRHHCALAQRPGDFWFARAMHDAGERPTWWDILAARTQRAYSQGAPE
jgi:hypothetical protein